MTRLWPGVIKLWVPVVDPRGFANALSYASYHTIWPYHSWPRVALPALGGHGMSFDECLRVCRRYNEVRCYEEVGV